MDINPQDIDIKEIEQTFADEVKDLVDEGVSNVISSTMAYNHSKVGMWVNQVVENCMKKLMELKMPRKYIVNATIMQKNGAGLHTATSCYWDNEGDSSYTHKLENKTLICVTTVYGLQL
eukprot:NODE_1942_length_802_cov_101.446215_g1539_i0.p1 GENE.NODE_1942_length_802_cov_101.446215_g1539_i0~~NODE_1942_length_802_cov_101.446215_g1539_i0.p1  ORF type:complete len:119 (+),score=15.84 NODE_1942_length_802_cov_101.446215_g1539_i0:122-478(+)